MDIPNEDKSARLLSYVCALAVSKRLGTNLEKAVREVAKQHEREWPPPEAGGPAIAAHMRKCEGSLEVLADLHEVIRAAEQLYRLFLPARVDLFRDDGQKETFDLNGLDGEGRPIYRTRRGAAGTAYLRWHLGKRGGVWAAHTDAEGLGTGDLHLRSPLPTDPGQWFYSSGLAAAGVHCVRCDTPLLGHRDVRALDGCWVPGSNIAAVCKDASKVLEEVRLGESIVASGETVSCILQELLRSMCSLVHRLELGDPSPPRGPTWQDFFASVGSLTALSGDSVWRRLSNELPAFVHGLELSWTQCQVYMCRVLHSCDLCNPAETWLPRLFHRLILRHWQDANGHRVRMLDLSGQLESVEVPRKRPPGTVRCVVVSDTHGWHSDLMLPHGDVLFHCGNLLLEGMGLEADGSVPADLERALAGLRQPLYSQFEWIFLVGGNHDRALHELWAKDPERLYGLLPPNLVILQAPAGLRPYLPSTCAAWDPRVRNSALDGAVKLLGDLTLAVPTSIELGCVIAGSGVSSGSAAWTANRAFQLAADKSAALHQAAEVLMKHKPDIVLTHGPPKGHCDLGRGDASLAEALKQCGSAKVHLFGHVHESYGVEFDSRCAFVNATTSTPLYMPTREPVVFDLNPRHFDPRGRCLSCNTM